jgi:pimeloyl-ACP methyl ester carboxylesterase
MMRTIRLIVLGLGTWLGVSAAWAEETPDRGLPRRAFLGTALGPVTDEVRQERGLGPEQAGAVVLQVIPGSTAEAAELQPGDVVTRLDETPIDGPAALVQAMSQARAGAAAALHLIRDGKPLTKDVTLRERPRESSDDFDVIYGAVESRGHRLRTIVTRPRGDGPFPALFLIQGIGLATVDNAMGPLESYRTITHDLTRHGFVTIRVDKPGIGDSEGGPARDVDFETELDGYRQALKAVKALPFVDPDRVLLFGHSMGGAMAPLLAAEAPVRGIAVYGTLATTWHEYMLENVRRQLELGGEDAAEIDQTMRHEAAIQHYLFAENQSPAEIVAKHPELQPRLAYIMPDDRYFVDRSLDFFRQLARTSLCGAWQRYDGRVLALWGRADFVSSEADHERIARLVNRDHPGHATFRALDGIDHGFNPAESPEDALLRAQQGPGEFHPLILDTLRDWARSVVET